MDLTDTTILTNYIYLLQEREFLKTKENVFKVGMTTKQNHERFNQYPKGSILLFQMICENCKNMETQIITSFKEKFTQRKDIGTEYFEGNYKNMIDIIYSTIKNELCTDFEIKHKENNNDEEEEDNNDEEETPYQITTYEEWLKYNKISKVIITNKKGEGYIRFKGQLWREFYDKTRFDFNEDMEDLSGFIQCNQPELRKMVMPEIGLVSWSEMMDLLYHYKHKITGEIITWNAHCKITNTDQENYISLDKNSKYRFAYVECDVDKIYQDILKKCYNPKYDVYELKYHEYAISKCGGSSVEYFIFNSLTFTFTPIDELIDNKILTTQYSCRRSLYVKDVVDVSVVDDILNSLINDEIKRQYKKLVYNLLVDFKEKQIIFYDYNECLLTTWIRDILYTIKGSNMYVFSYHYYDNKIEFKKQLKNNKPRCVIIKQYKYISIETQINDFCKLGFKAIIVCQDVTKNNMYNMVNFRKYLQDNKDALIKLIKNENNYDIESWGNEIQHDDCVFYSQRLLLTNYLKWCCAN